MSKDITNATLQDVIFEIQSDGLTQANMRLLERFVESEKDRLFAIGFQKGFQEGCKIKNEVIDFKNRGEE